MSAMRYVYVHGFNSGPESRSGHELGHILNARVLCPAYDYGLPFASCLEGLRRQILEAVPAGAQICLMGSSLGGFYVPQLRLNGIRRAIAWNPVVFPALQLGQFLGENTRFYDGTRWEFTERALLSYAGAPDGRQWDNLYFQKLVAAGELVDRQPPKRDIVLGLHDTLLDAALTGAFWQGHATISQIDAGHRIGDYLHVRKLLAQA